ncbi:MAG: LPS assembly lipoprotein LptE [Pseudomonadota bacterium]|nr:LPS assembly lipoprotein LptE [Pseudomonadota bacterium]
MRLRLCASLLLITALLLQGCGFQLRGSTNSIAKSYGSVHLINKSGDEALSKIVEQALLDTGTKVTPGSANILELLESDEDKRTASYSSRGKSAEYELLKEIRFLFRKRDEVLIPETTFHARRSYLYRETAAVGKAEEENILKREMDQDLAQRILLAIRRSSQEDTP